MNQKSRHPMFNQFRDTPVLITGHTGFKGSWLTTILLEFGANITGISLAAPSNGVFEELNLKDKINHYECNIQDYTELKKIIKKHSPKFIFHLAAQPLVSASYANPIDTYQTNVMGSLNIFESARNSLNEAYIINVTSDKCYENNGDGKAFLESDRFGGNDIYSSSKACAEILTQSYRSSFLNENNIFIASARAGNVIGGGDWSAHRIIPDCVHYLKIKQSIKIKNPSYIRPWQHVIEPLFGYIKLALKLEESPELFSSGWNFGPDLESCITVEALTQKVIHAWGSGEYIVNPQSSFSESSLLRLSIDKAKKGLNWHPLWNIDQTVDETILWYKTFLNHRESIVDLTKQQISKYLEASV